MIALSQSSKQTFLEIRDLTVTYSPNPGTAIRALDGIKLDIRPAEVLGILGESGCGKSTLAKALLQLLPYDAQLAGSIVFLKRDLLRLADRDLRAIRGRETSLIQQDPASALNPVITAGSQIGEVLAHMFL